MKLEPLDSNRALNGMYTGRGRKEGLKLKNSIFFMMSVSLFPSPFASATTSPNAKSAFLSQIETTQIRLNSVRTVLGMSPSNPDVACFELGQLDSNLDTFQSFANAFKDETDKTASVFAYRLSASSGELGTYCLSQNSETLHSAAPVLAYLQKTEALMSQLKDALRQ